MAFQGFVIRDVVDSIDSVPRSLQPSSPAPVANYDVHVLGVYFATVPRDGVEKIKEEMSTLNRWWYHHGEGPKSIKFLPSLRDVTDPLQRSWHAGFTAGQAGWHCIPVGNLALDNGERVTAASAYEHAAYVYAPSAKFAIEKARLLLYIHKKGE